MLAEMSQYPNILCDIMPDRDSNPNGWLELRSYTLYHSKETKQWFDSPPSAAKPRSEEHKALLVLCYLSADEPLENLYGHSH